MVFHCNYGRILYRFRNKAWYLLKNANFSYPLYLPIARSLAIVCCVIIKKYSTFVIFDPTQLNPSKTAKSRPNRTQSNRGSTQPMDNSDSGTGPKSEVPITTGDIKLTLKLWTKSRVLWTSSPAIAERPRDASCLSVVSFNSTTRPSKIFCY